MLSTTHSDLSSPHFTISLEEHIFQRKIVNNFLSISLNISFGCSKEPSLSDGSSEYPQHMFWFINRKNVFSTTHSYLESSFYHRSRLVHFFQRKILNVFLSISFNICFGCSKNRLFQTVLLSTHNICFGL